MCRPITLQPFVAITTCRKTCFSQMVLLHYKAKPHLGFQNLGCHCKILGRHFDTQNGLKNTGNKESFAVTLSECTDFTTSLAWLATDSCASRSYTHIWLVCDCAWNLALRCFVLLGKLMMNIIKSLAHLFDCKSRLIKFFRHFMRLVTKGG